MSEAERVEDTRTLKPGDRVTVHIVGTVGEANEHTFTVNADGKPYTTILFHEQATADRMAPPLPDEPPVGAEVLDKTGRRWLRVQPDPWDDRTIWEECSHTAGRLTGSWLHLLTERGPVRLLGDPIEAP